MTATELSVVAIELLHKVRQLHEQVAPAEVQADRCRASTDAQAERLRAVLAEN